MQIYVQIYLYIHIFVYIFICVYKWKYVHTCVYVYTSVYIYMIIIIRRQPVDPEYAFMPDEIVDVFNSNADFRRYGMISRA